MLPTISVVIPTYNCRRLLVATLDGLKSQTYPRDRLELLAVDGGSTDGTKQLLVEYGFRIIDNPQRSNLYGLPLGFSAARGELVLHLDDDNVLDNEQWLERMIEPFADPSIVAAEPLFYTAAKDSNLLTRYISLLGADDPLVVYLGFHDRWSSLTNTWTGVPHRAVDRGRYLAIDFTDVDCLPSIGCNAFLVRRRVLQAASRTPWLHIDGARRILLEPGQQWAKVRVGIINHHAPSILGFFVKKIRRLQTRSREAVHFEYRYPVTMPQLIRVGVRCAFVLPLVFDATKGFRRKPDLAWLLHPLLTLGTAAAYGYSGLRLSLRLRRTTRPTPIRLVR